VLGDVDWMGRYAHSTWVCWNNFSLACLVVGGLWSRWVGRP